MQWRYRISDTSVVAVKISGKEEIGFAQGRSAQGFALTGVLVVHEVSG
jgi:hypothetical protein